MSQRFRIHSRRRSLVRHRRTRLLAERLETRRLLAADIVDDLTPLSDEFDDPATLGDWSRINQTEGWNADQLETWDVDGTQPGRMTLIPHTTVWYQDYRGPLVYKEITGDFVVSTEVHISDRDDVGGSDADDVPNDAQYSLAGLMVRTPRAISSPADWSAGSMLDDGTNNGENFVFLSLGHGVDGQFSLEVKSTRNSDSQLTLTPVGVDTAEIQIARVGDALFELYRLPGEDWVLHRRYLRDDMPDTVQVGMVAYTDWAKASDFTPFEQNSTVLEPGVADPTPAEPFNPDLEAGFEYTRFSRPVLPVELQGVDLLNDATDEQLIGFLGDSAIPNPSTNAPVVNVQANDPVIAENGGATQWIVSRSGADAAASLDVFYSVYGEADSGDDYQPLVGQATIPAGELSVTIDLLANDDALLEGAEDVTLELSNNPAYAVGANNSATVWLLDDDLPSIGNQVMTQGMDVLEIPLITSLPDGALVSYSASVVGSQLAEWRQLLELSFDGSYHTNWGGQQEKWLTAPSGWHFLLPNGEFYSWGGSFESSTLLDTFDAAVYNDPMLLLNAQASATADIVAGQLVIDPIDGFVGEFMIDVSISSGGVSTVETIQVQVENQAPLLQPVEPMESPQGSGPIVIELDATDPDGDTLELTAEVVNPAYDLDQSLQLETPADYYENWAGQQEKWIQDGEGTWHYLLPSGDFYRWEGSFPASTLLAELGSETYDDPTRLTEATPLPIELALVGTQLTVTPAPELAGELEVMVRAFDGAAATEQTIGITIVNEAPTLAPIGDQVMAADQVLLSLALMAADPEGAPLQITGEVVDEAYTLDQSLGLWSDGEYYENWGGEQEKWIRDAGNQWLYLLPTGNLYAWSGSIESSSLVAELGTDIYDNPSLLTDAQPSPVSVQWTGTELEIARPAGYQLATRIRVTISDGYNEVSEEFWVFLN